MPFKKWQKPPKKWQKLSEVQAIEKNEEVKVEFETVETKTPVTTVIENEISKIENVEVNNSPDGLIWDVGGSSVIKPKGRIVFEAQVAPVPMFKMPKEIREYLTNNWFNTDLWKKDKEWLEKHNVDMEMVEKLKKFLTEKL